MSECSAIRSRIMSDFYSYIASGWATYDLNLTTLRVSQTSLMWSRLVVLTCLSSSVSFFMLMVSYMEDKVMIWSLYPAMVIMLPALWAVGFMSGAVSSRFVKIYCAASIRSPVLLKGVQEEERLEAEEGREGEVKEGAPLSSTQKAKIRPGFLLQDGNGGGHSL